MFHDGLCENVSHHLASGPLSNINCHDLERHRSYSREKGV